MIAGRMVGGRYLLLDELSRRGFGPTHRAEDRITGRTVAVTEIALPPVAGVRERLLTEVRAAGRLRHPAVVGVLDLVTDRSSAGDMREYLVTEHPDARPLGAAVAADPPSSRQVALLGSDVLAALRAVHADGGTHGGLDTDAVLVTDDGRALLTDVGLARAVGPRPGGSGAVTAPERSDTPAADLWCLGVVLRGAADAAPAPGSALATVLDGLTAEDPADRPTHDRAAELLERGARPRSAGGDLGRNRWILLGVAGVLAVVVVVLLVLSVL